MLCPFIRLSHQDGKNQRSQDMFSLRNKKKYLWIILKAPSYLELWEQNRNLLIGTFEYAFS